MQRQRSIPSLKPASQAQAFAALHSAQPRTHIILGIVGVALCLHSMPSCTVRHPFDLTGLLVCQLKCQ
jgi:hypothetical protein